MTAVLFEFFTLWTMTSFATGFGLGSFIRGAERQHQDQFLEMLIARCAQACARAGGAELSGGFSPTL